MVQFDCFSCSKQLSVHHMPNDCQWSTFITNLSGFWGDKLYKFDSYKLPSLEGQWLTMKDKDRVNEKKKKINVVAALHIHLFVYEHAHSTGQ